MGRRSRYAAYMHGMQVAAGKAAISVSKASVKSRLAEMKAKTKANNNRTKKEGK
jgi:hypothetical protein